MSRQQIVEASERQYVANRAPSNTVTQSTERNLFFLCSFRVSLFSVNSVSLRFTFPESVFYESARRCSIYERCELVYIHKCDLIVVYTQRRLAHGQELIRIISARQATRKERKAYPG